MKGRLLSGVSLVVAVGFLGMESLARPESALAAENNLIPTITVQIYNYSQASPTTLAGAEHEAGRILGEAGLRAIWTECPVGPSTPGSQTPCQKAPEATDLRLRILATPIRHAFQDDVFGFTVHPVLASVYYERVVLRAKSDNAEFEVPTILGCAIAHELGHLLLGPRGHSQGGIMQGAWEPKQFRQLMTGALLFTAEQSKLMRLAAAERSAGQNVTSASTPAD